MSSSGLSGSLLEILVQSAIPDGLGLAYGDVNDTGPID